MNQQLHLTCDYTYQPGQPSLSALPENSNLEHQYHTHQPVDQFDIQREEIQQTFQRSHKALSINHMINQLDYSNINSGGQNSQLQHQLVKKQSNHSYSVRATDSSNIVSMKADQRQPSLKSNKGSCVAQPHSGNLHSHNSNNTSLTGIRKIERVNAPVNPNQPPIVQLNRERSDSAQQPPISHKERNCKTTSPTGQIMSQSRMNESRMRKKSKEIKKKEGFADIIVILGIKYNEFIDQRRVIPQVVSGYPDLNNKDVAKEHNYVDNLIWICFPEGYTVQSYEKRKEGELCQIKIFHFIITNQDGDKKYITSILFKELFLTEKMGAFIVPKSICVVSSKPLFTLQKYILLPSKLIKRQLLTLMFQKVILPYNSASIQAFSQHRGNYIDYLNDYQEGLIKKNPDAYLMQRIEFYLTIFFNHLYYCEDVDKDIEIEQIRERSTPMGYEGGVAKKRPQSQRKITESYFRYRNTKTYGFTLENFSFELLLQSLKPERILFLITALLLERKIILIKENFGDIALIMESLVSLLNPLKWNFVFITYLTPKLVECLEAPFPYMIGVSRKVWEDHCVMREFPDDTIIYDIDNQELLSQVREELPALPQPQASVLQRSLKGLLDIKERFVETIQENATKRIPKDKIDEFYWAYAQLRVKQSFFNFLLLTINNYIGYFKNLDEEGDLSPHKKDKNIYDKLSSADVFDFDNYLNQFEGRNKDFMDKLVKTQSFNNFIEETYKNTSPQTIIGFFQTNFEVMLDYSFKKLKKEQNKLLDKTFFNLQNPVKFNIGHMFKEYKKKLLMKHHSKLKNFLKGNESQQQEAGNEAHIDIFTRQDILEKLLLIEIEGNTKKQMSILNSLNFDLITEMPGIQYEQIGAYEQRKTQRSDHSQDTRNKNKTTTSRNNSQFFEIQAKAKNSIEKLDDSDVNKSRNYSKIMQSKSREQSVMQTQSYQVLPQQKRTIGRGNIYQEYLSMEDSQNALLHSQEFNKKASNKRFNNQNQDFNNERKNQQNLEINKNNDNNYKSRVQSENAFTSKFGNLALSKTVIVSSNQHLYRGAAMTSHQIINQNQKSNSKRNNQLNQSEDLTQNLNNSQTNFNHPQGASLIQGNHNSSLIMNDKQQSLLKETLNKKILYERNKHGLHLNPCDAVNQNNQNPSIQNFLSCNKQSNSIINLEDSVKHPHKHQHSKFTPKSNIDLMNPRNKKISRNEERKIAQKKGFLDPQQHESFQQFIYSPNKELSKLAMMQLIQRRMDNEKFKLDQQVKDSQNFSNFSNFNYNSNASDEDLLTRILQNPVAASKVQFQTRLYNESLLFQGNDPLSTTINFQSNFVQQKPQMNQSPSISNTEMSSVNKKEKWMDFNQETEDSVMVDNSSPEQIHGADLVMHLSNMNNLQNQLECNKQRHQLYLKNEEMKNEKKQPLSNLLLGLKTYQADYDSQQNSNIKEEHDTVEIKNQILTINDQARMKAEMKHQKLLDQESPKIKYQDKSANISFKQQINNPKQNKYSPFNAKQSHIAVKKNLSNVNPRNKSPNNIHFKEIKNPKKDQTIKQQQQTEFRVSTFDNNSRDQQKQQATNALSRKRSQPALIEKSPKQRIINNNQNKHQVQNTTQDNNTTNNQSNFTYFKQRPINQNAKNKTYHIPTATLQINLEKKEKLSHQAPTREIDLSSLRVSPIPPDQNIPLNQNNQQTANHRSCSGISDDQVVIYSNNDNNRVSNFMSKQSNLSMNHKSNSNEVLFDSISNMIEEEIFDKAHMTKTVRLDYQGVNSHKNQTQSFKSSLKNQLVSISQRSSSNVPSDFKIRSSQLSQKQNKRTSQHLLLPEQSLQERKVQKQMLSNNCRESDLLSSHESSNHITIKVLRNSPRLGSKTQSKAFSNNSQQLSAQSSLDKKNMKSILGNIKQNQKTTGTSQLNLDLHKRNKQQQITTKEVATTKSSKIPNNLENRQQRTSSIEELQSKINMSNDTRNHQDQYQNTSKYFNSNNLQKKKTQSPQPQNNLSTTNANLKQIQSQEFQLKEKGKRQKNMLSSNIQSSESLVQENIHQRGQVSNFQEISNEMQEADSNQNLQLLLHESSMMEIKLSIPPFSMKRTVSNGDTLCDFVSKSTKNLYSQVSKDKLLQEIDGVNHALFKIEESRQNASKSSYNILEETLTNKSNSNASYQTSPLNFKSGSSQIRGFKSSSVFKSITQANNKAYGEEQSQNSNQIATVRTKQYPQKNFQIQKVAFEDQKQIRFHKQHSEKQEYGQRYEEQGKDQAMMAHAKLQQAKGSFNHEFSRMKTEILPHNFITDIDHLMNQQQQTTKRDSYISDQVIIGEFGECNPVGQYQITNNQDTLRTQEALQHVKTMHYNMSEQIDNSHPLNEIRNNQNQVKQESNRQRNNGSNSLESSKDNFKAPPSGLNSRPPKNTQKKVFQTKTVSSSSKHLSIISVSKQPNELGKSRLKQDLKKNSYLGGHHELSTCFAMDDPQDSLQHGKRDHNLDVFCKINSHIGDIDNDPHTPKSDQSYRSIEKRFKRKQHGIVNLQETVEKSDPIYDVNDNYILNQLQQHNDVSKPLQSDDQQTPLQAFSYSVDCMSNDKAQRYVGDDNYNQLRWRLEVEESKKQNMEESSQALQKLQNAIVKDMCSPGSDSQEPNEVFFDEADLKDTDDKFTSRDFNFNRLKNMNSQHNDYTL